MVSAINVAVAPPFGRDALVATFTGKLIGGVALGCGAVTLVRAVLTIFIMVTHPAPLDAVAVSAGEFIYAASVIFGNNYTKASKHTEKNTLEN